MSLPTSGRARAFLANSHYREWPASGSRPIRPPTGSQQTPRWREMDSNLYGAFPVKRLFWVVYAVGSFDPDHDAVIPLARGAVKAQHKSVFWKIDECG
jgi:hypothetical protein